MSASWSNSRDRQYHRAYRRPRRSAVPQAVEIDTQTTSPARSSSLASQNAHSSSSKHTSHKIGNTNTKITSQWEQETKNVEILPGSLLIPEGEPWRHPPEPIEAPPLPTEIVQFLVVGGQNSGKTSLSRRFQRMHCTHLVTNNKKSIQRKETTTESWSVEYHKKDVTFWLDENNVACARVQLWDVTGGGSSDKPLERRQEWMRLVQKMSGILLVVSLEHGPDATFQSIVSWKQWLDECCPSHPQVHLLLQKCDLLPCQSVKPLTWIELGSRISKLCDEMGISADWKMTTCCAESAEHSPEQAIMELVQSIVTTTVPQRKVSFKSSSPTRLSNTKLSS